MDCFDAISEENYIVPKAAIEHKKTLKTLKRLPKTKENKIREGLSLV